MTTTEFQEEIEHKFSLKAFVISKGQHIHLWEVISRKFEGGEAVTDKRTGRHGQIHIGVWDAKLEEWRYCIGMKDVDDFNRYIRESQLTRAPAQTRIDTGKTMLYAPRRLKRRRHLHGNRPTKADERWLSRSLVKT